jgi:hypothetical protein
MMMKIEENLVMSTRQEERKHKKREKSLVEATRQKKACSLGKVCICGEFFFLFFHFLRVKAAFCGKIVVKS